MKTAHSDKTILRTIMDDFANSILNSKADKVPQGLAFIQANASLSAVDLFGLFFTDISEISFRVPIKGNTEAERQAEIAIFRQQMMRTAATRRRTTSMFGSGYRAEVILPTSTTTSVPGPNSASSRHLRPREGGDENESGTSKRQR